MASEPQYIPPEGTAAPQPQPDPPRPARRGLTLGLLGIIALSAVVGAIAGSAATILTAQRLSQAGSPASTPAASPKAPFALSKPPRSNKSEQWQSPASPIAAMLARTRGDVIETFVRACARERSF